MPPFSSNFRFTLGLPPLQVGAATPEVSEEEVSPAAEEATPETEAPAEAEAAEVAEETETSEEAEAAPAEEAAEGESESESSDGFNIDQIRGSLEIGGLWTDMQNPGSGLFNDLAGWNLRGEVGYEFPFSDDVRGDLSLYLSYGDSQRDLGHGFVSSLGRFATGANFRVRGELADDWVSIYGGLDLGLAHLSAPECEDGSCGVMSGGNGLLLPVDVTTVDIGLEAGVGIANIARLGARLSFNPGANYTVSLVDGGDSTFPVNATSFGLYAAVDIDGFFSSPVATSGSEEAEEPEPEPTPEPREEPTPESGEEPGEVTPVEEPAEEPETPDEPQGPERVAWLLQTSRTEAEALGTPRDYVTRVRRAYPRFRQLRGGRDRDALQAHMMDTVNQVRPILDLYQTVSDRINEAREIQAQMPEARRREVAGEIRQLQALQRQLRGSADRVHDLLQAMVRRGNRRLEDSQDIQLNFQDPDPSTPRRSHDEDEEESSTETQQAQPSPPPAPRPQPRPRPRPETNQDSGSSGSGSDSGSETPRVRGAWDDG